MARKIIIRFIDSQVLGEPDSVEKLVDMFHYQFVGEEQESNIFTTAYSAKFLKFIGVIINRKSKLPPMKFTIICDWNRKDPKQKKPSIIQVNNNQTAFMRSPSTDHRQAYSETLLDIGRNLFTLFKPNFGWIDLVDDPGEYHPTMKQDDLKNPIIAWATFYSGFLVGKIREGEKISFQDQSVSPFEGKPTRESRIRLGSVGDGIIVLLSNSIDEHEQER